MTILLFFLFTFQGEIYATHVTIPVKLPDEKVVNATWRYVVGVQVSVPLNVTANDIMGTTGWNSTRTKYVQYRWDDLNTFHPMKEDLAVFSDLSPVQITENSGLQCNTGVGRISAMTECFPFQMKVVAPILAGDWILIGEVGKFMCISAQRVVSIAVTHGSFTVSIVGAPGEKVTLGALHETSDDVIYQSGTMNSAGKGTISWSTLGDSSDAIEVPIVPEFMSAFVANSFVGENYSQLKIDANFPTPAIQNPTQVLIRVIASSVNPIDWKLIQSNMTGLPTKFPSILGMDAAGVIVKKGVGTDDRLHVGDRVWMDLANDDLGGYGEYVVVEQSHVGHAPSSLNFSEAGSLPLVAMTGLAALTGNHGTALNPPPSIQNKVVMVLGGSGGCGSVGIEIAIAMGAKTVYTTTSPAEFNFVRGLGVAKAFDYHLGVGEWARELGNESVDVVYDTVGEAGAADVAMGALREGGVFVTIAGALAQTPRSGRRQAFIHHWMKNATALDAIRKMVDEGHVHAHVSSIYGLNELNKAFALSQTGSVVGKLVIDVSKN